MKKIGLICLVLIFSPGLFRAVEHIQKRYQRYVCGTNLKGLGQAHITYANDYDDEYVVQGQGGSFDSNMLMVDDPNGNPVRVE